MGAKMSYWRPEWKLVFWAVANTFFFVAGFFIIYWLSAFDQEIEYVERVQTAFVYLLVLAGVMLISVSCLLRLMDKDREGYLSFILALWSGLAVVFSFLTSLLTKMDFLGPLAFPGFFGAMFYLFGRLKRNEFRVSFDKSAAICILEALIIALPILVFNPQLF